MDTNGSVRNVGPIIVNRAVRRALHRLGAEASYAAVLDELAGDQLSCSYDAYARVYKKLFPSNLIPRGPEPADKPVGDPATPEVVRVDTAPIKTPSVPPVPAPAQPQDRLSDFVRFATVVEVVGGVGRAREYLGVLEQLLGPRSA